MKITIWTLATDGNNNGTSATVHLSQADAQKAFYEDFVAPDLDELDEDKAEEIREAAESEDYESAAEIWDLYRCPDLTYSIEEHTLEYPTPRTPALP